MTCEALEMESATKSSDELASKMCTTFPTHALLLDCSTVFPAGTSWPLSQLLLVVHIWQSIRCLLLFRGIGSICIRAAMSSMRWAWLWMVVRSGGVVVVESAIGRGHGPVLRWETHPNSLEGLPPGNAMPAWLDCRPHAIAHDLSPIVDWRCSQWARQWQKVWRGCCTRGDSCSGSG